MNFYNNLFARALLFLIKREIDRLSESEENRGWLDYYNRPRSDEWNEAEEYARKLKELLDENV